MENRLKKSTRLRIAKVVIVLCLLIPGLLALHLCVFFVWNTWLLLIPLAVTSTIAMVLGAILHTEQQRDKEQQRDAN